VVRISYPEHKKTLETKTHSPMLHLPFFSCKRLRSRGDIFILCKFFSTHQKNRKKPRTIFEHHSKWCLVIWHEMVESIYTSYYLFTKLHLQKQKNKKSCYITFLTPTTTPNHHHHQNLLLILIFCVDLGTFVVNKKTLLIHLNLYYVRSITKQKSSKFPDHQIGIEFKF